MLVKKGQHEGRSIAPSPGAAAACAAAASTAAATPGSGCCSFRSSCALMIIMRLCGRAVGAACGLGSARRSGQLCRVVCMAAWAARHVLQGVN